MTEESMEKAQLTQKFQLQGRNSSDNGRFLGSAKSKSSLSKSSRCPAASALSKNSPSVQGNSKSSSVQRKGELGSVTWQGSRKAQAKGLDRINTAQTRVRRYNQQQQARFEIGHGWSGSSYNKEHFVRSLCQFLVFEEDAAKCDPYMCNPDLPIDWDLIQEIRVYGELPDCPICIGHPVAAQMTRCGHIYCYPCILHYLALSDQPWRKCPICYESVYKKNLRSVTTKPHSNAIVDVGSDITLVLMKRARSSNYAYPVESEATLQGEDNSCSVVPVNDVSSAFNTIVKASLDVMNDEILSRERAELCSAWIDSEHEPEIVFVEEAQQAVEDRRILFESLCSNTMDQSQQTPKNNSPKLKPCVPDVHYVDAFENVSISHEGPNNETQFMFDLEPPKQKNPHKQGQTKIAASAKKANDDAYQYFYQAENGDRIFLHPINVRCLIAEYGSLEQSPLRLSGKLVDLESASMTAEFRARFKPLGHLPLTTQFQFAELKLARGVLSRSVLDSFADEFRKRREWRLRREREEKLQDVLAEQYHQRAMMQQRGYSCPQFNLRPESDNINPEIPTLTVVPSAQSEIESFPLLDVGSPPIDEHSAAISFAQMLRRGRAKQSHDLPSAVPGTSHAEEVQHDEDQKVAPKVNASLSSAVEAAFSSLKTSEGETSGAAGGKKGKKKKKIVFQL